MTDKDLSQTILDKIHEEHITPKPRWTFLLKDSAVWSAGVASLLVGGVATSIIIHMVRNDDWIIMRQNGGSPVDAFFAAMPYLWMFVLLTFVAIAHYNFTHTNKGYLYRLPTIAVVTVLSSVALGIAFYNCGAGEAIDDILANKIPVYERVARPRIIIWSQPQKGMLAGTIVEMISTSTFELRDFNKRDWIVHVSQDQPILDAIKNGIAIPRIRCVGNQISTSTFNADTILPWKPQNNPKPPRERTPQPPAYEEIEATNTLLIP